MVRLCFAIVLAAVGVGCIPVNTEETLQNEEAVQVIEKQIQEIKAYRDLLVKSMRQVLDAPVEAMAENGLLKRALTLNENQFTDRKEYEHGVAKLKELADPDVLFRINQRLLLSLNQILPRLPDVRSFHLLRIKKNKLCERIDQIMNDFVDGSLLKSLTSKWHQIKSTPIDGSMAKLETVVARFSRFYEGLRFGHTVELQSYKEKIRQKAREIQKSLAVIEKFSGEGRLSSFLEELKAADGFTRLQECTKVLHQVHDFENDIAQVVNGENFQPSVEVKSDPKELAKVPSKEPDSQVSKVQGAFKHTIQCLQSMTSHKGERISFDLDDISDDLIGGSNPSKRIGDFDGSLGKGRTTP